MRQTNWYITNWFDLLLEERKRWWKETHTVFDAMTFKIRSKHFRIKATQNSIMATNAGAISYSDDNARPI